MIAALLFEHTTSGVTIGAAILAAIAASTWFFWKYMARDFVTVSLALLRLAFLLVLLWCLLLPTRKTVETESLRSRFLVAVDLTASMRLAPAGQSRDRWDTVIEVMQMAWPEELAANFDLEIYPFDKELGAQVSAGDVETLEPQGESSWLRQNLTRLSDRVAGQPIAGCLLLTDGIDTREASDDWTTRVWNFPIYTVRMEDDGIWSVEPDVHVDNVTTPRRVRVGWDTDLKVALSAQGTQGEEIRLRLFEDGQPLDETTTQIPAEGGAREVIFRLSHDEVGTYTYRIDAPPFPDERKTNDNTFVISVQVVDTRNRLLYAEDTPRWESKFLSRVLKANEEVQSLIFLRGPGGKFMTFGARGTTTLDMTPDQLSRFKIVILGNFSAEELGEQRAGALTGFVEGGGSLLVIGGDRAWGAKGLFDTSLARVLPFTRPGFPAPLDGRFPIEVTDEGLSHQAFLADPDIWRQLPPVISIFPGCIPKGAATTLAEAVTDSGLQPLILSQRQGSGKVAALLTDSIWRWQLTPNEDKPYPRFWNQMILWLLPDDTELEEDKLELFVETERLFIGDTVRLSARIKTSAALVGEEIDVTCTVATPDDRSIPFPMKREDVVASAGMAVPTFHADLEASVSGTYRVSAVATTGRKVMDADPLTLFVKPYSPEKDPRPASIAVLKALSAASGGRFCEPTELDSVLGRIQQKEIEEERVSYASLWDNTWVITCLMVLLSIEWTIRKMKNMA